MKIISGEVIHGKALARKIGFPTANLHLENGIVEDGTFKINIILDGKIYLGAGAYREKELLFEAHLFNFDGDLYGETIEVVLLEKIRENKPIKSLNELKQMIEKDIKYIKENTFYGITFGTFDKFHPGHAYYLNEAKKYCETLITVISTDKNVEKIKNHTPHNSQEKRKYYLEESKIPDLIFIGDEDDHLKYIKKFQPKVVCLGYDQEGFIGELQDFVKKSSYNVEIIRVNSLKPEVYKSSKM